MRLVIAASDSAGGALTYQAGGLPDGLSIDAATGLITGTPRAAGVSSVTVTAADSSRSSGRTTFRWTIGGLPGASRGSVVGLSDGRAKLSFSLAAGYDAPPIEALGLAVPSGLSFARSARVLARDITIAGPGGKRLTFATRLRDGALAIAIGSSVSSVQVTIKAPAIRVSAGWVASVRRGRKSARELVVGSTDTSDHTSLLVLKVSL